MAPETSQTPAHQTAPLRFAVIGSGPAGIYACESLLAHADKQGREILIDLVERLPVPYGLLRFGVAPDHPRIKGIARVLHEIVADPRIRYLGGIEFGTDLTLDDARSLYHGVLVCTGALSDRSAGIPGEDLAGSHGAAEFVTWYDGHPDAARDWDLSAEHVAVIGVGNVALDVARMMLRSTEELDPTDIPAEVRQTFATGSARVVSIVGRRGPAWVKFTPQELREIGQVDNVTVVVDPTELELDAAAQEHVDSDRRLRKMYDQLTAWTTELARAYPTAVHDGTLDADTAQQAALDAGRKVVRFRFHRAPVEVLGADGKVTAVRLARTEPLDDGRLRTTDDTLELPAEAVYFAVGYRSTPLPGVPFDDQSATIPNDAGRVLDATGGSPVSGLYTAGWIKRGPSGVIGTNRSCAAETVESVWADLESGALADPSTTDPDVIRELMSDRDVHIVDARGWDAIDARERELGAEGGRERTKIRDREELLRLAVGAVAR